MWPKISLSMRSLGIAPQLIAMKGRVARWLCRWIASAQTSLPVPDSPVMKTVARDEAALSMIRYTACIASDEPMKPW